MAIYHHREDMDNALNEAMLLLIFSSASYSQLYFRFRRAGLVRILRLTDAFIWEDLPHIDPETGSLAMAAWIPRVQKISFFLTSVASLFHVTQSSIRLLTSEDRPMIYGTWYPFDITKSPTYELMNIAQGIASVQWICFLYGLPAFYGTLVSIACSQLEKLRANLLDIRQKLDSGAETAQGEGRQVQPSQEVFCGMQEQLTECIRHHQLIIEYIRAIEEMFNPFLAGYFLNLMCGLCFTAYTAVTRLGDLLQLSQTIVIYSFYAINVFVFCWFGSELSDQAERVRDAAWGCDWVGTPLPFMRCLSFIIKMANKEFVLTAGKFVPVSKATMMNMMQESVSLFMFLLQMKQKEDVMEELK
ncbi:odorant receptor 2a-like [Cryptotermes secundus]|uniref:odorant receptor 2a-like n=1 Tax=Cryptotermes secundus TaxID=105785 RepID=UPI001454BF79|nr:odorant receptor 2a-like [Cryptotermes secundus]